MNEKLSCPVSPLSKQQPRNRTLRATTILTFTIAKIWTVDRSLRFSVNCLTLSGHLATTRRDKCSFTRIRHHPHPSRDARHTGSRLSLCLTSPPARRQAIAKAVASKVSDQRRLLSLHICKKQCCGGSASTEQSSGCNHRLKKPVARDGLSLRTCLIAFSACAIAVVDHLLDARDLFLKINLALV